MSGSLTVVATPIGNLADLSPRALATLREVDVVLAEDTRVVAKLLAANGLGTPVERYDEHTRGGREDALVERLQHGLRAALVSDAGTPNVADPGGRLVERAVGAGIEVRVVPGPSALTAAMAGSGLNVSRFTFYGFLPLKKGRQTLLAEIASASYPSILFESPHRLVKTLAWLAEHAPGARVVVARELTKVHETFHRGTAVELLAHFSARPDQVRGECTLIIVPDASKPRPRLRPLPHALRPRL